MHHDWHHFLATHGAQLDATGAVYFPAAPVEAECALIDRSDLGVLAVGGADADHFLQRQVSNDLRELTAEHSHLSSHCNAKGRVVATFRVIRHPDGFWLIVPRTQLAVLRERLQKYVLRARVSLADVSDTHVCLGVLGTAAAAPLTALAGPLPPQENGLLQSAAGSLIRVPGAVPRWLFVGAEPFARQIWSALSGTAVPANTDLWLLHDIRAGLPTVYPATRELFVPQMLNLHLIDGVSFHKGCYLGQEVVARMQYLGKLKRRMYWTAVGDVPPPQPGDALSADSVKSEQGPGTVVDARRNANGHYELLVVADIATAEQGTLRLGDQGPVLALRPPPYGFPEQTAAPAAGDD